MISSNDANGRPAQTEITLTSADLAEIKQFANREYLSRAVPRELENSEFLVLCYAIGVDKILNKKGFSINITYSGKLPYEPVE